MRKVAFLFPGQGSQFLGMGQDLFLEYDFVREIFDATNEATNSNISKLCFKGPMEVLYKTINLQPAITAVNIACLVAIEKHWGSCDIAMGHSLGEYSALKAARVLSLSDTMQAVFLRGRLMHREALKYQGSMAALIGLDLKAVKTLIREQKTSGVVSIANQNAKKQIVISGDPSLVKKIALAAKKISARVVPLKVSGAWHSAMMIGVEAELAFFLNKIEFNNPICKIIHNVNANIAKGKDEIKKLLVSQVCNPVLWYDSICKLVDAKIEIFVEIGPGKVLTSLLKKTLPKDYKCKIYNVYNMKTLEKFLHEVI